VVDWINYLKDNLSGSRAKFNKNLLASIFRYAHNDLQILDRNVFDTETVRRIKFDTKNVDTEVYTIAEVSKILQEATNWLKVYLDLSFKYGFRPGEIMVLKWKDIDLENGILYLKRSLNKDGLIIEHSKNKSNSGNKNHLRRIPLFDSSLSLLKSYAEVKQDKDWLFTNKDGKPFMQSASIINYHLKPFLNKIGVEYKTLYATRRSYASIMNFSGEDLEKIQEVMGHKKGSTVTEDHYILEEVLSAGDLKKQAHKQEELFDTLVSMGD
jgi:integrase